MFESGTKVILSDSLKASLDFFSKNQDPSETRLITSSPQMLRSDSFKNCSSLHAKMTPESFEEQRKVTINLTMEVYSHFIKQFDHSLALSCASTILELSKVFFKLLALSKYEQPEKYLIIKYSDNKTKASEVLNFPWENFIPEDKKEILLYTEDTPYQSVHDKISLKDRLLKAGLKPILFRLFIIFFKIFPNLFGKRKVFIYKENDLLIETALELVFKGYSIHKAKPGMQTKTQEYKREEILNSFSKSIEIWLSQLHENFRSSFENYAKEKICETIKNYFSFKSRWEHFLTNKQNSEIKAVLTNSPNRIDSRTLFQVLRNSNIPLIAFQHGITREVSKFHDLIEVNFENNTCDHFICFNEEAIKVSSRSPFDQAKKVSTGTSRRFINNPKTTSTVKGFVYVSTFLPKGNTGFHMANQDDYLESLDELSLVEKAFSQVNEAIDFKPYLFDNRRYSDPDITTELIEKESYDNIRLLKEKIDMRYLLNQYRVIITSRATSTISWPILADKPTVFLNYKVSTPLREEVIKDFEKGIFLFNISTDKDLEKLTTFLNQPISEIEKQWKEKKPERDLFIKKYFSEDLYNGSVKAANYISKILR